MISREVVAAIAALDLPAETRLVLLVLWSHVHDADPEPIVWPSTVAVAAAVGCEPRSATRHLARLAELGLISAAAPRRWTRDRRVMDAEFARTLTPVRTVGPLRPASRGGPTVESDGTLRENTPIEHTDSVAARGHEVASEHPVSTAPEPAPPVPPAESDDDAPPWLSGDDPLPPEPPPAEAATEAPAKPGKVPRKRAPAAMSQAEHELATDLWTWHEVERIRLLHHGTGKPRIPTDAQLRKIVALVDHIQRTDDVDRVQAWARARQFRANWLGRVVAELERGADAPARQGWARGETAWRTNVYDMYGGDPPTATGRPERGMTPEQARAEADRRWGQRG